MSWCEVFSGDGAVINAVSLGRGRRSLTRSCMCVNLLPIKTLFIRNYIKAREFSLLFKLNLEIWVDRRVNPSRTDARNGLFGKCIFEVCSTSSSWKMFLFTHSVDIPEILSSLPAQPCLAAIVRNSHPSDANPGFVNRHADALYSLCTKKHVKSVFPFEIKSGLLFYDRHAVWHQLNQTRGRARSDSRDSIDLRPYVISSLLIKANSFSLMINYSQFLLNNLRLSDEWMWS